MFSVFVWFLLVFAVKVCSRNIYVDLGANCGDSVQTFLDNAVNTGFDNEHNPAPKADRITKNWELYVFEANSVFTANLTLQRKSLLELKTVKAYNLYANTAIYTKDGTTSFVVDHEKYHEGSTIMRESYSATSDAVTVKCIDIVSLFKTIGKFTFKDKVYIKMDVEGAEYPIIRRMIQHGLLSYVEKIAVEW